MWMLLQGSLPHPLPREPPPRGGLSFKRRRAFKASLWETGSPDTGEVARSAGRGAVARSAGGRDFALQPVNQQSGIALLLFFGAHQHADTANNQQCANAAEQQGAETTGGGQVEALAVDDGLSFVA